MYLQVMSHICTHPLCPPSLCSSGGHRVPGVMKVPSEVALQGGVLKPTLRPWPGLLWRCRQCPAEVRAALAGVGAQTGALCILWLLGTTPGKGTVPYGLPCVVSAKFIASLEDSCIKEFQNRNCDVLARESFPFLLAASCCS